MSSAIKDLIFARRTVHNYLPEPVPKEVLLEALSCGLEAPNHHLTNPWRFTVIGPNARKAMIDIAKELRAKKKGESLTNMENLAIEKKINNPGAIVAVGCLRNTDETRMREDYATVSCAIQNISLYLWDKGFGSKWGTGAVTREPRTYELLGIDSEQIEIIGFLYSGKAERTPSRPKRPTIESDCTCVE